jgi:hypothetical protein
MGLMLRRPFLGTRHTRHPPDLQEGAVELVLEQAQALGEAWM